MKVITICGSLKFEDVIKNYTQKLELEGNCVLSIVYSTKDKNTYTNEAGKFEVLPDSIFYHIERESQDVH